MVIWQQGGKEVAVKKDRIEINKNLIPYSFDITLGGEIFEIGVNYNEFADMFTLSLTKDRENYWQL